MCQTNFGKGVWFTFTPSSNALLEVSTCGSDFDTVVQVYTDSCGSLSALPDGCNDDDGPVCFGSAASVHFNGTGGTTYHILAGGYGGETGTLRIQARIVSPAPNDACSEAIVLTAGAPYTMDTAGATSSGDASPICQTNFGKGVWFVFTPNSDGLVEVSTCGSDFDFDTVLQIYTGSCGSLAALPGGCNDDNGPACFASQASVRFSATSGTAYYVLVGGFGGSSGSLQLHARMLFPPVNDTCAGAIALTPGIPLTLDTTNATSNGDSLPRCQTNFANGVWFTFTPNSNGLVEVSTCGSGFDTVVQAYAGSCGSLSPLTGACNNDNGPVCFGSQASVRFSGTSGNTYYILAGSFGAGSGMLQVHARILVPPSNAVCPGAIALTDSIPYTMDTTSATTAGDFQPTCQTNFSKGVWFTFTPDSNAVVEVNTCNSGFNTAVQVYTGSCDSLSAVPGGCNDQNGPACSGSQASVRFSGTGGTTYYILTGGFGGGSGFLQIQATTVPPPPNDACSGGIALTSGASYIMDTAGATSDGDPLPTCRANFGKGVWFTFTPDSDGLVEVSTCSSGFDTLLQVFAGSCDDLTAVPGSCNDDNGPACPTIKASVRFVGSGGVIYYILAGGFLGSERNLQIKAAFVSCSERCLLRRDSSDGRGAYALDTAGRHPTETRCRLARTSLAMGFGSASRPTLTDWWK
jgi:predicted nucleic acid binding AN1-type Zn finger protein